MSSLLSALYSTLDGDATLTGLLPGGVYTTWATEGQLPRAILRVSTAATAGYKIREGTLDVDLFAEVNDMAGLEAARDRVIALLEGAILDNDETGPTLRVSLLSEALIPEPDDRSAHWSMTFELRFYRKKALGQES